MPELVWTGKETARQRAEETLSGGSEAAFREFSSARPASFVPGQSHLISGDNLEALKLLKATPGAFFDFIYIDPPYNTGQTFSYSDSFVRRAPAPGLDSDAQSNWLTFMYPLLVSARALLADEGYLFVSIDDREVAHLSCLLFEIFGRENHLGTLKWRKKRKRSFLDRHMSSVIEYVLVFAKNARKAPKLIGEATGEVTRPVLNLSNAVSTRVLRAGTEARCRDGLYRKGLYRNKTLAFELLSDVTVKDGRLVGEVSVKGPFRVGQAVLDATLFVTKNFGLRRHVLSDERTHSHASDECLDWPTNEDGDKELREIFGERIFDFPKPTGLIRNLLRMCASPDRQKFDLPPLRCLDFFAGSGTLAHAVLAQNEEDGLARTFTCVQSEEPLKRPLPERSLLTVGDVMRARVRASCVAHRQDPSTLRMLRC